MKKLKIAGAVFSLLLLSRVPLCARGAQELIKSGSWVYDAMASLYIESGYTDFSDQSPLSVSELRVYLEEINYDSLSPAGKAQYNRILDFFDDNGFAITTDAIQVGIRPEITLEGYVKNNDDIPWVYDYYKHKPLIYAPVFLNVMDYVSMGMDLQLAQNKCRMMKHDNHVNIPLAADQMDINFPDTGYLSTGFKVTEKTGINFQIGMGAQNVGRSANGSIITSEYFTGSSYANLEIYNPNLRYNMNVNQFNVDKYMYTHRFDFRIFRKFQFSVQESMLVYSPSEPELRYLNPLTIFHGMAPWRDYGSDESNTCAYLALKASFAPSKYFRIYGLFAQDQFQTAYETSNWPDDTTPNAMGGQLGIESWIPYKNGYFHTWLEGYYAQPYLYIKEDPNWSLVRTYSESIGDQDPFYEWIGSPFGPDTIAAQFSFGYEVPGKWSVDATYLFMAKGELSGWNPFIGADWGGTDTTANLYGWPFPDKVYSGSLHEAKKRQKASTPSGTTSYVNRVSVKGTVSPTEYVSFAVQPSYVHISNYGHVKGKTAHGFEVTVSATIKLHKVFRHA